MRVPKFCKSFVTRPIQNNLLSQVPLSFCPRSSSNVDFWWVLQQAGLHRFDLQFAAVFVYQEFQALITGRIAVVSSRFTYKLPGISDLNFRAHHCRWIWFLSTSTLDLRPTTHSLLSGSTVFTSYRFCSILWALSLTRCGRITIILALSKIASADLSLIYRLVVQIDLISFILIK